MADKFTPKPGFVSKAAGKSTVAVEAKAPTAQLPFATETPASLAPSAPKAAAISAPVAPIVKANAPTSKATAAAKASAPKPGVPVPLAKPRVQSAKAKPVVATPAPVAKASTPVAQPAEKPAPVIAEPVKASPEASKPTVTPAKRKENIMSTVPTFDFTESFKSVFGDFQEKAKEHYEKSKVAFGDYNELAKGNVEAAVESGKILASGLQELGATLVADSRASFETLTAEAKEVAGLKSPTDLFKLQSEIMRKQFDSLVSFSSKQSEALLKLAGEVAAPLSNRVAVAVETAKKVA